MDSALGIIKGAQEKLGADTRLLEFEGDIYLIRHEFDRAASLFQKMSSSGGGREEHVRTGLWGIVRTAEWSGRYRDAIRYHDREVEFESKGKDSTLLAGALASRAYLTAALTGDTAAARSFGDRALGLKKYGDSDYYINLQNYFREIDDFTRAGEIARTRLVVQDPWGVTRGDAIREFRSGNYGSAIRTFQAQRFLYHEDLYMLAKSFAATDQPDSALAVLGRLKSFYGGTFGFPWMRALVEAKGEYLAATIHEKLGDRKKAVEGYTAFLKIWEKADADIPELVDGKKRLAALKGMVKN